MNKGWDWKKIRSYFSIGDIPDIVYSEVSCEDLEDIAFELKQKGIKFEDVAEGYIDLWDIAEASPTLQALLKKFILEKLIDEVKEELRRNVNYFTLPKEEELFEYAKERFYDLADSCTLKRKRR